MYKYIYIYIYIKGGVSPQLGPSKFLQLLTSPEQKTRERQSQVPPPPTPNSYLSLPSLYFWQIQIPALNRGKGLKKIHQPQLFCIIASLLVQLLYNRRRDTNRQLMSEG
ncbi:unnamed protein product [Coffea canephora]|uniref:Uncharacterized protein n=1 Tax=Coffea canephora TaxID=49390 RepID=A0A068UW43_COFCA|nr:unnamed protein product [Coffea canephora]